MRPDERTRDATAGWRHGGLNSFLLRPNLELDLLFDDNIFRTLKNAEFDRIHIIRPSLTVESNWLNHGLVLRAGGEFGLHEDFEDENYEDYFL